MGKQKHNVQTPINTSVDNGIKTMCASFFERFRQNESVFPSTANDEAVTRKKQTKKLNTYAYFVLLR